MSSPDPTSDPRSVLPAAITAATIGADLDTTLAAILATGVDALRPAAAAVFLQDPDRPALALATSVGLDDASLARLIASIADPDDPFVVAARDRVASFERESLSVSGEAFVGAYLPLAVSTGGVDAALGSLGMSWRSPRILTDVEREVLGALASLIALAVDRARLSATASERSEWFERMAHTDALTGLANERTVARILELELARAARQGSEVSLAMFDIDDFRATNADDGHDVGDDVLRRVASVLAESVRLVDTVGRIGGDEFVLVAPGAAGGMVARRVLDGIEALPALSGRSVSVSAGVARFPADGGDSESLIAAATEALARAKDAGRGNVAETDVEAQAVPEA